MAHLKQHIGLWQGTGLLVSTLLGSGVFIVPAIDRQSGRKLVITGLGINGRIDLTYRVYVLLR